MNKNIGTTDRIIRVFVALIAFIGIGFVESKGVLLIVCLVSLFTAVVGWCGLYSILKINTNK